MSLTEDSRMRGVVLLCGQKPPSFPEPTEFETVLLPSCPGKAAVDPWLENTDRLVIAGTDADLAAVITRLLRKQRLNSITVGFIPAKDSVAAKRWQLPSDTEAAFSLALHGVAKPQVLIRDDAGGILVGQGVLNQIDGEAYCDEELVLRGKARSIVVEPDANGVSVRAVTGSLLKKTATASGRAFQIGCHPTTLTLNGQVHSRLIRRWTWYRHVEDLQLACNG